MRHWLQAILLMASGKKGISSNRLVPFPSDPRGSGGKVVEADETFIGRVDGMKKDKAAWVHKSVVLTP
jgi:hypothetical protein